MAGVVLQPVDPSATGEVEVTKHVREALKRKRDDEEDEGGAPPPTAAATGSAPVQQPKTCVHEVALPAGYAGDREALLAPRYGGPRAKTYPFTLDPFQETAIACLVRKPLVRSSGLSRAHTALRLWTLVAEHCEAAHAFAACCA